LAKIGALGAGGSGGNALAEIAEGEVSGIFFPRRPFLSANKKPPAAVAAGGFDFR
jgi:hypothetical protein